MVHFHRGSIAERVAASCCMPVMFSPVNIDGTNYVDGGLMMNLPVSTLRRVCNKVVAVNVSPIMAQDYKMNIVSIAMRSFHFMFRANTFPEREKCDLLIEPYNLYGYSNTELETLLRHHVGQNPKSSISTLCSSLSLNGFASMTVYFKCEQDRWYGFKKNYPLYSSYFQ